MKIVLKNSLRPRTPFTDKWTVKWVLKYVVALWLCFLAMQECQNEANGGKFRLRDLLSVPMQRVLKYPLLLRVCSSYMWSVFSSTHCVCGYAPPTCGLCSQVPTASAGMLLLHVVCVLKYPLLLRVCSSYMWSVFSSTHCLCGYAPPT